MAETKKAVAKKEDTLPANLIESFEEDADSGFENATAESFAIPFLAILQANSPQVKKTDPAYIQGAEEGDILDTVSMELFKGDEGVTFIPCAYRHAYVEWIPRDAGGGYVGEYTPAEAPRTERDEKNRDIIVGTSNELMDTRYHSGLIVQGDDTRPVVIAMTRTQVKKSKRWMSVMNNIKFPKKNGTGFFRPPMYSHIYRLKTVAERNDEYSWANWDISLEGPVKDMDLIAEAKSFHDAVRKGEVREATDSLRTTEGTNDDNDSLDDNIAF